MGKLAVSRPHSCPPPFLWQGRGPVQSASACREAGTSGIESRSSLPQPGQQGAAALEFALVAPLFLILWFGVLDFGLVMYAKGLITHASQEGARYGAIYHLTPPNAAQIQGYVQNYLRGAGFSQPVSVSVTGAGGASGSPLPVRVDYSYHFLGLPRFLAGWADSLNLSAETTKWLE